MTLQQLLYFREVAYEKHFTRAAENLYVAQSSISHAIHSMENELGVPLFVRNGGKDIALTSYGQAYLPYVEEVFAAIAKGQTAIDSMRNPSGGVVNVLYSFVSGFVLVSQIFNKFYEKNDFSDILVQFELNINAEVANEDLLTGKIDLGISGSKYSKDTQSCVIAKQELVVLLPKNHPLAGRESVTLFDIKDDLLISFDASSTFSEYTQKMYAESGIRPNTLAGTWDWTSLAANVSMGRGVMISPRLPVDKKTIAPVKLEHPMRYRDLYLSWPTNRKLSPAAQFVRDFCVEHFNPQNTVV